MSTDCECVVIGAGVVGLAIAAELAKSGREVLILEREASFGTITSARNSEVIHAGIYYPADSLKARFCVKGKQQLYSYCEERHIAHHRTGKLIVATTDAQVEQLASIEARARANGVSDIQRISAADAKAMEPELMCKAALYSTSTGIIDSHALMVSLLGDAQNNGAVLACSAPVEQISMLPRSGGYALSVGGEEPMQLSCNCLINAAGHEACALAYSLTALAEIFRPKPYLLKGNYFRLNGKAPFSRLIYPVPEPGGLGVHITLDLGGQARFGPDVEPVNSEDYAVDPVRSEQFYSAIRRYWPQLPEGALAPDYAGIRPKIEWGGEPYNDFLIQSPSDHGLAGFINLFGIESPGLTSCLAIAEHVQKLTCSQ